MPNYPLAIGVQINFGQALAVLESFDDISSALETGAADAVRKLSHEAQKIANKEIYANAKKIQPYTGARLRLSRATGWRAMIHSTRDQVLVPGGHTRLAAGHYRHTYKYGNSLKIGDPNNINNQYFAGSNLVVEFGTKVNYALFVERGSPTTDAHWVLKQAAEKSHVAVSFSQALQAHFVTGRFRFAGRFAAQELDFGE